MTLDVISNTAAQIDLIYVESGKYQEVSNTMFFKINNKLNLSDDKTDLINDLRQTVMEKLYIDSIDVLKAFKLCYSICKLTNDSVNLKKISSSLVRLLNLRVKEAHLNFINGRIIRRKMFNGLTV